MQSGSGIHRPRGLRPTPSTATAATAAEAATTPDGAIPANATQTQVRSGRQGADCLPSNSALRLAKCICTTLHEPSNLTVSLLLFLRMLQVG